MAPLTILAVAIFAYFIGIAWGSEVDRWWRRRYGPTRSVRTVERLGTALWAGFGLLGVAVMVASATHPWIRRLALSWVGLTTVLAAFVYARGYLRSLRAFDDSGSTRVPEGAAYDHEGVTIEVSTHRTGRYVDAAVVFGVLPPLGAVFAARATWGHSDRAEIRLGTQQLRITEGDTQRDFPLCDTTVTLEAASDGTPLLVLSVDDEPVEITLGGTPIRHVQWLVEEIRTAAANAGAPASPAPLPEALRALLERTPPAQA